MKKTIALAMLALAAMTAQAQTAPRIEIGAGAAYYTPGEDTFWYQKGLPHKLSMTAPALSFGVSGDAYSGHNWGITYRLAYTWFGTARTDALAVADADYDPNTQQCTANCDKTSKFVSSGHAQAVTLSFGPYVKYQKWTFGIEAGPSFFRNTWKIDVAGDQNVSLEHRPTWELGYMLGASVGYGEHLSLAYQYFKTKAASDDPVPYFWRSIHFVSLRYRF